VIGIVGDLHGMLDKPPSVGLQRADFMNKNVSHPNESLIVG